MTTYRAIAASEVDADSPVTATLMQALVNNLLAVQEGDATAPDLTWAAVAPGLADMVGDDVGSFTFAFYSAGGATAIAYGDTVAGSTLTPASVMDDSGGVGFKISNSGTPTLSGTWTCWGSIGSTAGASENVVTLFQRTA